MAFPNNAHVGGSIDIPKEEKIEEGISNDELTKTIEEEKKVELNQEENLHQKKEDSTLKKIEKKIIEKTSWKEKEPVKFLFFNFINKSERAVFLAFMVPPIFISIISMIHIVSFFELTNSTFLAWMLSGAFEFASISALFALGVLTRIKKNTIWTLFVAILVLQIVGNVYHAYINLNPQDPNLLKLLSILGINITNINTALQIIGFLQGAILPIISLTFVKSTVDYLKERE